MTFIAPDPTPGWLRRLLARLRPQSRTLKLDSEWKDVGWLDLDALEAESRLLREDDPYRRHYLNTWVTPDEPEEPEA